MIISFKRCYYFTVCEERPCTDMLFPCAQYHFALFSDLGSKRTKRKEAKRPPCFSKSGADSWLSPQSDAIYPPPQTRLTLFWTDSAGFFLFLINNMRLRQRLIIKGWSDVSPSRVTDQNTRGNMWRWILWSCLAPSSPFCSTLDALLD